jgi:exodeoxyribonuclease III
LLKIATLNLNGIRSAASKGLFEWLGEVRADIVCLQELKAQLSDLTRAMYAPNGYRSYFHCAEKKGYSGVGIYARKQPDRVIEGVGNPEFDAEGRYLRVDWHNLSVVSLYVPSGSSSVGRQEAKFRFMDAFYFQLDRLRQEGREIVICGDWNIAHREIDLKNWRSNRKNSGFLPEERAWLTRVFDELGWVDVHRRLYPEAAGEAYTWWSNRGQAWTKNVGWRIDYQIASKQIAAAAVRGEVFKQRRFSDHAPLVIDYAWSI